MAGFVPGMRFRTVGPAEQGSSRGDCLNQKRMMKEIWDARAHAPWDWLEWRWRYDAESRVNVTTARMTWQRYSRFLTPIRSHGPALAPSLPSARDRCGSCSGLLTSGVFVSGVLLTLGQAHISKHCYIARACC